MAAWYEGVDVVVFDGISGGGQGAIADLHATWNNVSAATTVATLRATAHALLGATIAQGSSPPACNQVAVVAWMNAMTDLGNAATIEQNATAVGPPAANAAQDANEGFDQLGIVATQGQLAMTGAAATPTQAATSSATSSSAPVAQASCAPTISSQTGTQQAEAVLTGNGYHPINSIVDTGSDLTLTGGALGTNSTGAEAVLMLVGQFGQTPAVVISEFEPETIHTVNVAAAPQCGSPSHGAVIITGSEANVIAMLNSNAYGTNPLPG